MLRYVDQNEERAKKKGASFFEAIIISLSFSEEEILL